VIAMQHEKDLVVLVPDKNAQFLFSGILSRSSDLGLRPPTHQIDIHLLRDSGCLDADELLQSQANRFAHAMVVVADRARSGHPELSRDELEAVVERKLAASGWEQRASAVVVEPGISRWLLEHELGATWSPGVTSLERALEAELRRRRMPRSPDLYRALGARMVDEGEADPAWRKVLGTLFNWFAEDPAGAQKRGKAALQARFDALVEAWLKETRTVSSFRELAEHPAYRAIIGMGTDVVPLILRDLEREPKYWGPALRELTGAQPVPKEHAGKVRQIAADWIAWAKEHGYVW
jgi:hypothetical protein